MKQTTSWPKYLQAEICDAEKTLGEQSIWAPPREIEKTLGKESSWPPKNKSQEKKSVDVIAVVRVLINKKFGIKGDGLGLDNVEHMDNEIFRKIYIDNNKVAAAKDFMKKYKGHLSIDTLYKVIPIFPWGYVKDVKE